jgi:replicative DNA helicase
MNQVKIPVPVGEDGLLPPQNIDAERAILGALLLQPDLLDQVADILPPDAFYVQQHATIYRAMLALGQSQLPCDLMQVSMRLQEQKKLDAIGGRMALAGLLDSVVSAGGLDLHRDLVLDKWRRRRLGQLGSLLCQLQHDPADLAGLLAQAEERLYQLLADKQTSGLVPLADVVASTYGDIEQRIETGQVPGIRTGFFGIDRMLNGGMQAGDLVIVAGRPAMGKTAWALNVASNVAATGAAVAIFSLEMEDCQLAYRLFAAEAGIEAGLLKLGRLNEGQLGQLANAVGTLSDRPIWIDDGFTPSFNHIRSQCLRLAARTGGLGLVMLDYLQLVGGEEGSQNRVLQLGQLTRQLKTMARELGCPVLVLSQLSRGVESRTNKRPMMSDLRDSGAIEQDADLIMMLYRDEYYDPETPDRGIAEVIITKHRSGPTGTVRLLFEPALNRFHEAEE